MSWGPGGRQREKVRQVWRGKSHRRPIWSCWMRQMQSLTEKLLSAPAVRHILVGQHPLGRQGRGAGTTRWRAGSGRIIPAAPPRPYSPPPGGTVRGPSAPGRPRRCRPRRAPGGIATSRPRGPSPAAPLGPRYSARGPPGGRPALAAMSAGSSIAGEMGGQGLLPGEKSLEDPNLLARACAENRSAGVQGRRQPLVSVGNQVSDVVFMKVRYESGWARGRGRAVPDPTSFRQYESLPASPSPSPCHLL